jgi:2-polyprenyl-6-hydroxyphenyl methylase/3-demethylubiquinone-9 3-methyltransferase
VSSLFVPAFTVESALVDLLRGRSPLSRYRNRERGMSVFHDWFDWLGGYPFEVAAPGEVLAFLSRRGFSLERLQTRSSGCNEYVFVRR